MGYVTWGIHENMYAPFAAAGERPVTLSSGVAGQRFKQPRQPVVYKLASGVLLAQYQGHTSNTDQRVSSIFLRRSLDNAQHWGASIELWCEPTYAQDSTWLNNGTFVQAASGRVHAFFTKTIHGAGSPPAGQVDSDVIALHCYSDNEGLTWSTPTDVSASVKPSGAGWWITGPAPGIRKEFGTDIGRLLIPFNYRDSADTSGAPRSGVAYSDDDGATWQVGMLLTDDGSSEASIAECLDGSIYLTARKQSNGNTDKRWYATSTDGGETVATSGAETSLTTSPSSGNVCRVGNYLVLSYVGDTGNRSNLYVARSSAAAAGSVSWTTKLLYPGLAGYSTCIGTASGEALVLFEGTYNTAWAVGQNFSWYQYILQAKLQLGWWDDTYVPRAIWAFNRQSSGSFTSYDYTVGTPLLAQGDYPLPIQGGPAGSFNADGAESDGSGTAAILAMRNLDAAAVAAVRGNIADAGTGSWSAVFDVTSTQASPSGKVLMGNRTTGKGWSVTFGASGVLVFTAYDTTAVTCTSNAGTDFTDGVKRRVRIVINRSTNKLEMYVNGTMQTDNPAIGTGAIVGTTDCIIGAPSGTPAAWKWGPIAMARGIMPDDTFPPIVSHAVLSGGFLPVLPQQPDTTDIELWLAPVHHGGTCCGLDFQGGWDRREMHIKPGMSFWTMRDAAHDKLFVTNSQSLNRGFLYRQSTGAGLMIWPSSDSASGGPWRQSPGTDYDFIASDAVGTFLIVFEMISESSTFYLWDSMGNSNIAAGWALYYDPVSDKLGLKMGTGSASRFAENPVTASPTFNYNISYGLAVRFNGAGQSATFRRCVISGTKLLVRQNWNSNSACAQANGVYSSSARPAVIGARSDDTNYTSWMFKNAQLYSRALTDDEVDDWFHFSVAPIYPPWTARRRRAA